MRLLLRALAWLSLRANHAVGAAIGRLVFAFSPRYRACLLANLASSRLCASRQGLRAMARANAAEMGKAATELAWTLFRSPEAAVEKVRSRTGWEAVERLRAAHRSIVFVTPHLGAYDVMGRYLWAQLPGQVIGMYRPHKLAWLDEVIREGRGRGSEVGGDHMVPANLSGVRRLLKHLKAGGCTLVLPDQVPSVGDGEWADFFGQPAYTMTLVGRLQHATHAALVFCYAERLPRGEGFVAHFHALETALPDDRREAAGIVNREVERLVRECPEQYLWGYNRYKRPAGAPPPPACAAGKAA
ncbi:MAG TPA: lysophospholipid acyltransferase family protein [Usitatibacter sp.]|nr:lysophospholipid acyltransferase family protein [Usitatibacter sp.]